MLSQSNNYAGDLYSSNINVNTFVEKRDIRSKQKNVDMVLHNL